MVSIIIPMYNAEKTIINCLTSIKNQTYKGNIEVIIIDDGSKDNSNKLVKKFIEKEKIKDFRIIKKKNGGVSSARNMGLRSANGNYIALLDSDDTWLPKKLEKQMKILERNKDIDFIGCNRNNETTKILWKKIDTLYKVKLNDLLITMFPQTSTAIFKKEILKDVGYYDETQTHAEDGNFWLRICATYNFYMMPESLVITGDGKPSYGHSGLSANLEKMFAGEQKNFKELLENNYIGKCKYYLVKIYAYLKYIRRIMIVNRRKK